MKRLVCSIFIVVVAIVLGACAKATSQPSDEMINPGDKIGDFLITTGEDGDVLYPWDYSRNCTDQGDNVTFICNSIVGKKVNITAGLYDDSVYSATPTEELEKNWSSLNYTLTIEGRPVNLQAFGYIETQHPILGIMRFWDVVIVTDKPGEIHFVDSGTVDGEPFNSITTFTFSAP